MPKAFALLLSAFLSLLCTCGRAQSAYVQAPDAAALQIALERAYTKGNLMVALSALEWRPGLALAATRLDAGQTTTVAVRLQPGYDYAFLATTVDDTADLDLYLRDSLGNVLSVDQEEDDTPILEFRVTRSGTYRLQLHLAGAAEPVNYVAVALLRSAGASVAEGEYRTQLNRFFTAAGKLAAGEAPTHFVEGRHRWPVQAYLLTGDQGITVGGIAPPGKELTLAATANPNDDDVALAIADPRGVIVAHSSGPTAYPLVEIPSRADSSYKLHISSTFRRYPTLVLVGVFQWGTRP